jgi:uncharacterized membrane protein
MNEAGSPARLPGIDVLRGVAVAAMIVYHFTWDLRYFGLIQVDVVNHPFWQNMARAIAGSFLLLSGMSLALMTQGGFDRAKFLRRFGIIAGAALLVTVATWLAMPNAFIFFGILHCIALSSVLALPFLRLPVFVTAAVALIVFALPFLFTHAVFDAPLLQWIGLGTLVPITNDYVPLFPWFAVALAGVVIGKLIAGAPPAWLGSEPAGAVAMTARAGRLSLPIYLIHQPILMALVGAASLALPGQAFDEREAKANFQANCLEQCRRAGGLADFCPKYCGCAEEELKRDKLWRPLIINSLTTRQQTQVTAITEVCQARAKAP